ncbi:MAG TPA: hypothetical protein VH540_03740 [Ktedonobacterales bacterium]|jgi:hypothetical protein
MNTLSSRQHDQSSSAETLGARLYEYRAPASAKLVALGICIVIPVMVALFLPQILRPASLNDRLLPTFMLLVLVLAGAYLAYRQAYFAWAVITIHEHGLRLDFWRTHLRVPWASVRKFYLTGRSPRWHLLDADERVLCELKSTSNGQAFTTTGDPLPEQKVPPLPDAIIEQAGLVLQETPYRHYAPAPRSQRKGKKTT